MATKGTIPSGGALAAGDVDLTFGEGGVFSIPHPHPEAGVLELKPVSLFHDPHDPEEGFFVYGNSGHVVDPYHYLVRVLKNGVIDTRYGEAGYALLPMSDIAVPPHRQAISFSYALFDEFGAVILFGQLVEVYPEEIIQVTALVRLNSDGSPDEAFGDKGLKTYNALELSGGKADLEVGTHLQVDQYLQGRDNYPLEGRAMVMQSGTLKLIDGKVTFLANRHTQGNRIHVASYVTRIFATDGRLDESFGDQGQVLITYGAGPSPSNVEAVSYTVDDEGSITVTGDVDDQVVVTRYRFDGRLDDQFGDWGQVLLRPSVGRFTNRGLVIGRDERVIVLNAIFGVEVPVSELIVLRRNGTVDTSFNHGAPLIMKGLGGGRFVASALNQDDGGRLLASGYVNHNPYYGTAIYRVLPAGLVDDSFGTDGFVADDRLMIWSVLIQPPANIVVSAVTGRDIPGENSHPVYRLIG